MPANPEQALDQAIAWHLAMPEMSEGQWREFILWLEASPSHQAEFDRIARVDQLIGCPLPVAANFEPAIETQVRPKLRTGPRWALGAIAALIVGYVAWSSLSPMQERVQVEQTAAGTTKQITFSGRTRIDLNGETKLILDQSAPRQVKLESGEALFSVKHESQPFIVEAGGFKIKDLGTIFNVRISAASLEVKVREGQVLFDPEGANLKVSAGEMIAVDRARNVVIKAPASPSGDWLAGELAFENSTLSTVAAAMHRRSGINIQLADNLSNAPFTGNIKLSGDEQADAAHLARLIGASYRREGDVWVLSASSVSR